MVSASHQRWVSGLTWNTGLDMGMGWVYATGHLKQDCVMADAMGFATKYVLVLLIS